MWGFAPDQIFAWGVSVVNFAIMFVLFRLVVIEPMFEAVELREKKVRNRLAEIDDILKEVSAMQVKYEVQMENLDEELAKVRESAASTVKRTVTRIEEKAEAEATYVLEKADREANSMQREVEAELRERITAGAIARARTLLEKAIDKKTQGLTMEHVVDKVGELSAT